MAARARAGAPRRSAGTGFSPLGRRLWALIAIALFPAAILGALGLVMLAAQQRAQLDRATIDTARAIMSAVDKELEVSIAEARVLSKSRALEQGDLRAFHADMRRALSDRASWDTIVLVDRAGRQLLNARRPHGSPPQPVVERESYEAALAAGRPVVGNIARGPGGELRFPVRFPVMEDGEARYVLTIVVKPEALLPVLERQRIPEDAVATVFDGRGHIVARTRRHAELVGTPISAGLRELVARGNEGAGPNVTLDGTRTYSGFARSQIGPWGIGLGVPRDPIDAAVRRSYVALGAGIVLSLALGALGAAFIARRIARPVLGLAEAADAIGRGEPPVAPRTDLAEVNRVASALVSAGEARARAEAVREEALVRERRARAQAEDANRMKDEFLAMLGHELRNPLAAIANAAQLLRQPHVSPEWVENAKAIIGRQSAHLARLVDDLLDVGRVIAGKIVLERVPVSLPDAVRHALSALRAGGYFAGHRVDPDLGDVWVSADPVRLDQVVTNLLINAAKYTPSGKRIVVASRREGDVAVLSVVDEGVGIEAELLEKVFEPFVQGKRSLDRAQGGLGIGLTLVRRLVELHGGTVSAGSGGRDAGAAFTVRLPAIAAPAGAARSAAGPVHARGARDILVVEDNPDARAAVRLLLETRGHNVSEAADGAAGIELAASARPDVAFVDLGLPGVDGYEVARRLRSSAACEGTLLVALTGYGMPDDIARSRQAGFDLHLVKPLTLEALEEVLARADARPRRRSSA